MRFANMADSGNFRRFFISVVSDKIANFFNYLVCERFGFYEKIYSFWSFNMSHDYDLTQVAADAIETL